jgi:hypothetical protein
LTLSLQWHRATRALHPLLLAIWVIRSFEKSESQAEMAEHWSAAKREKMFESSKKILRYVNRVHNLSYTLVSRLAGGFQSGAYLIETAEQEKAVLKWNTRKGSLKKMDEAAGAIQKMKETGWPTPAWIAWGISPSGYPYQVLEFVEGQHRERVDTVLVKGALPIIDLQAGKAPDIEQNWTTYDRSVAYEESDGIFNTISKYSDSGKALIDLFNEKLEPFRDKAINDKDAVHGDFHNGNVFMQGNVISGVIDAESIGRGSRLRDVADLMAFVLLFDGEEAALDPLLAYMKKHAEPGELEICFCVVVAHFLTVFMRKPSEKTEEKIKKVTEFTISAL